MRDQIIKRTVSIPAIIVATGLWAGLPDVALSQSDFRYGGFGPIIAPEPEAAKPAVKARPRSKSDERKPGKVTSAKADPVIPPGPLAIVVAIDKQRVTLFADGKPVTSTAVSTGTPGHPTPMGVFSVIQKRRHHVSNLYAAEMPFMQRLTWFGTAMHQGPLPGRPASHGCIRLPGDFAELLWKTTKIGARVIVTRDEVAPAEFDMPWQFTPRPKTVQLPGDAMASAAPVLVKIAAAEPVRVKTVDASGLVRIAEAGDAAKPAKPAKPVKPIKAADEFDIFHAAVVRDVDKMVTETANIAAAPAQASKATVDGDGKVDMMVRVEAAPVQPSAESTALAQPAAPAAAQPVEPAMQAAPAPEPPKPVTTIETPNPVSAVETPKPVSATDEQPAEVIPLPIPAPREAKRSTDPISVFISRKESKLYVRRKMEPLFSASVTVANPDAPIGTHVYTVMGGKDDTNNDTMRWTVISIPSSAKRPGEQIKTEGKKAEPGRKHKPEKMVQVVSAEPLPGARAALDRIDLPPDAVERISDLLTPGSSIIVSDNKLSDETGEYTDFIVLTP